MQIMQFLRLSNMNKAVGFSIDITSNSRMIKFEKQSFNGRKFCEITEKIFKVDVLNTIYFDQN